MAAHLIKTCRTPKSSCRSLSRLPRPRFGLPVLPCADVKSCPAGNFAIVDRSVEQGTSGRRTAQRGIAAAAMQTLRRNWSSLASSALHVSPARRTSQFASRRVVGDAAHDQSEGATVRGSIDPVDTGGRKLPRKRQAVGAGGDDPRVEHRLHRRVRRQRRPAGDGDRSRHVRRRGSVAGQCLHTLPFGVSADRGRRRRSFRPPPHIRRRHRDLRRRFTGVRAVGRHDGAHSGARDARHRGGVADPVLARDHRSDIR